MKHPVLLSGALFLLACAASPQDDEARRLREELAKVHLENLELKLRLTRLSGKPDDELKILGDALGSRFAEVASAALRELAALPEDRRRATVPLVLDRYASASEAFRLQAIALFLARIPSPEVEATLLRAASDVSAAVRRAAASALKTSPADPALRALVTLLQDRDEGVRLAAIDALGTAKREAAVAPLVGLLSADANGPLVEKTVDALGAIGSSAAVDPLLALLARTDRREVRWSCIRSLGIIGDRKAAPLLRPFLDPSRAPEVRQIALAALGKMKDVESVPAMAEILKKDADDKLRLEAASSIGLAAPAEAIDQVLLPAYLQDASEPVRQGVWAVILSAAGEQVDANDRLARALLARSRRAEADQACARLHALKPDERTLPRLAALEDEVARALFDAGDSKAALPHYQRLADLAPDRRDASRRLATCYRELKDLESCVKTLRGLEPRLVRGDAEWWAIHMEILAALGPAKDPESLIEEAHALLATNPPPHPEDRRKTLEQALRAGLQRLLQAIAEREEAARKASLESCRRLGKKIAGALAAELETGRPPGPILEAGNAAAQTTFDPATADPAKLKEIAAAWRAWAGKN